ncbi:MAG: hypothetical protein QOJ75_651, partial [Chloroflexota bacterium]|nr:hypothetical protein [Chloroflexota bacterium]
AGESVLTAMGDGEASTWPPSAGGLVEGPARGDAGQTATASRRVVKLMTPKETRARRRLSEA